MSKVIKKVAPIAFPILGSMIPGLGTVLGSALGGAVGGVASGGGLKGALKGAALSGLTAGVGNAAGGAAGGLGKAGTAINWTSAAPGYSTGLQTVGGSGVLGALSRGGAFSQGVGNALGSVSSALKGVVGTPAGSTLDTATGVAGMQGPTMGTGALGAATRATTGLGLPTTGAGGGLGSLVRTGASIYSGLQEDDALKEAQRAQLAAVQPYQQMGLQAQQQLSGNLAEGFDPGDLTNDQGYQFRLNQGMDALNSQLAAQGLGQSGAALKAAQEYGQGFAQNEYGNAYDRWLQQNQQLGNLGGQGLAPATDIGNINSATTLAQSDAKNRRIAEILSGLGI